MLNVIYTSEPMVIAKGQEPQHHNVKQENAMMLQKLLILIRDAINIKKAASLMVLVV